MSDADLIAKLQAADANTEGVVLSHTEYANSSFEEYAEAAVVQKLAISEKSHEECSKEVVDAQIAETVETNLEEAKEMVAVKAEEVSSLKEKVAEITKYQEQTIVEEQSIIEKLHVIEETMETKILAEKSVSRVEVIQELQIQIKQLQSEVSTLSDSEKYQKEIEEIKETLTREIKEEECPLKEIDEEKEKEDDDGSFSCFELLKALLITIVALFLIIIKQ